MMRTEDTNVKRGRVAWKIKFIVPSPRSFLKYGVSVANVLVIFVASNISKAYRLITKLRLRELKLISADKYKLLY